MLHTKMAKLYTKTGDDGTTGLFGGDRVMKDHPRVETYGTVDELNAVVGLCASACDAGSELHSRLQSMFIEIQSRLFDLGADLATPHGSKHENKVTRISSANVQAIESWIDEIDAANASMTHFVLPGGTELAGRLHLARTVCRRAERCVLTLHQDEPINEQAIILLNRLSDLFFAMARRVNLDAGVDDVKWVPGES